MGNIVNIVLDSILIYKFNFGIFGAGLATTAGCFVSFILFYYLYYVKRNAVFKLGRQHFKYDIKMFKEIIDLAIPLVLNGFVLAIMGLLINYSLHVFSNPLISFGYVVLLRIQTLMFTPIQGISQSFCIVTAHLTGAKRFRILVDTLKKSLIITVIFAGLFGLLYLFSYHHIISFFTNDINAKNAIGSMIVFSVLSFFFQPSVRICNYTFVGLGKSVYSLLSLVINIILFVVFMLIGTLIFKSGEFAIFMVVILSDITQVIVMLVLLQRVLSRFINSSKHVETSSILIKS